VQVDDVVSNPGDSWSSALRYAAFALMNHVRPLGQDTLRLSCGLRGTGMAIRREVLERQPWQAFSVAEDCEYHARLVLTGGRTAFAHEASVRSEMPASLRQARAQHERYEAGKWELIRRWAPRLLASGLRRLDPIRLHTGFEALVPPQALLFAANVLLGIAALATWHPLVLAVAGFNVASQGVYVAGGLALAGAPGAVWRALLLAPVLVVWKVWLYAGILAGRGSRAWVRGPRQAESGR
jgi:cellulose synthase/poly-beta-1,6-N-acetylglucosamine synthase-like glycosyltransferase